MKNSRHIISALIAVLTLTFLFSVPGYAANEQKSTLLKASNITDGIQLKWDTVNEIGRAHV